MFLRLPLLASACAILTTLPLGAVELIMVEQPGCYACKQWNDEIGAIYPKTEAGTFAPLRREQLRQPPADVTYSRRVNFTPTFILVDQGTELARIEGYPGEDFFWWYFETMLADHTTFGGATR